MRFYAVNSVIYVHGEEGGSATGDIQALIESMEEQEDSSGSSEEEEEEEEQVDYVPRRLCFHGFRGDFEGFRLVLTGFGPIFGRFASDLTGFG